MIASLRHTERMRAVGELQKARFTLQSVPRAGLTDAEQEKVNRATKLVGEALNSIVPLPAGLKRQRP